MEDEEGPSTEELKEFLKQQKATGKRQTTMLRRGLLVSIRDGTIDIEEAEELQQTFNAGYTEVRKGMVSLQELYSMTYETVEAEATAAEIAALDKQCDEAIKVGLCIVP